MKVALFSMKRYLSLAVLAAFLVALTGVPAADAATTAASKDEKKLSVGITMLNSDAKLPGAEKVLMKQLSDEFGVKQDKISSLKNKNLKYGEITAVLAMAEKLDGGVTDANINRIMAMKPGSTANWGRIASNLNVDIGDVADKVFDLEDNAHSNIKEAALEAPATGRGAGGVMDSVEGVFEESPGEGTGGTSSDSGTGGSSGGGY